MAGDDVPSKGIPAWQRAGADSKPSSQATPNPQSTPSDTKQPQADESQKALTSQTQPESQSEDQDLLNQARRFLEDKNVRDRSDADKIAFLESKGMTKEDIRTAMEGTQKPTARAESSEEDQSKRPQVPHREMAPIITYPEAMLQPTKPPPIITGTRLINTAYAAAGFTALVYGANRFLIQPMFQSLSAARHDFASHTKSHIDELNEKLTEVVSKLPNSGAKLDTELDDNESYNSDPTELFHRDFGTQTADLETPSEDDSELGRVLKSTEEAQRKISQLKSICEQAASAEKEDSEVKQEMIRDIKLINSELENLTASSTVFNSYSPFDLSSKKQKDDEITKFKNETRNFKGQLLSARNFPRR